MIHVLKKLHINLHTKSRALPWLMDRSRLRKILIRVASAFVLVLAIAVLALSVALKPYQEKAASFDLTVVPHGSAIPLDRLPKHVIDAVVASEDSRFFSHGGVDLKGICRAALVNIRGKQGRQGASTITQQLARQTYGILEKTVERKLVEAFLARRIEKAYEKQIILSNYLSIIYFGNGYHGIEQAAEGYFGKDVEDLTVTEGATLAGLIKAPSALEPFQHPERARKARNLVLGRMATERLLSTEEAERLRKQPVRTRDDAAAVSPL